ncbi:MAG: YitT family protein [Chloroflexi bacterium]|nr:YitT family protein [Chloroflexota bacterium]
MNSLKHYWPTFRDYVLILVGSVIEAIALRLFLVPANLASGGVSGIAQLLNHFTGWPIGVMVLVGNLPLFVIGWRYLGGRRFALRSAFSVIVYSLVVDLIPRFHLLPASGITDDIFLNSLYGAVVAGVGYGLVYRARSTSGGSDILARILNHYRSVSMTQSYLMVDSSVILAAGFVFGWKQALYAIITLYVSGIVSETILEGSGTVRTALIITAQPDHVSMRVLDELERGVTILQGTGAYTGEDRPVLYCVITRAEVAQLKAIVQEADPQAFIVIGVAHEALGEGFKSLQRT